MRFTKTRMIGSMMMGALALGCSAGDELEPSQEEVNGIAQGLTIFSEDPETGLTGMYAEGETAVFFDTARNLVPDADEGHNLWAPDGTAIAVSARFVDMEGRSLAVNVGDDGIPESWPAEEDAEIMTPERHKGRQLALDLVLRAGKALQAQTVSDMMGPEKLMLIETASVVFPTNQRMTALAEGEEIPAESTQTTTRQYFEIRADFAHQSSWWQNQYYSGGWWHYSYVSNWNHGARTSRSEPTKICGVNTGNRTYYITGSISCGTVYRLCDANLSAHNCRSDTQYQQDYVVDRSWNSNWHCNNTRCISAVCY